MPLLDPELEQTDHDLNKFRHDRIRLIIVLIIISLMLTAGIIFYYLNINKKNIETPTKKTTISNELQKILYMKTPINGEYNSRDYYIANYDGAYKTKTICDVADIAKQTGRIINIERQGKTEKSTDSLWVCDKGSNPKKILDLKLENHYIISPKVTDNGDKIAYIVSNPEDSINQLWTINSDGSNNRLEIDQLSKYIKIEYPIEEETGKPKYGLYQVSVLMWSLDEAKIYLLAFASNGEPWQYGLYAADLTKKEIRKINTPKEVILKNISFSPDYNQIAYTFTPFLSKGNYFPHQINIIDLGSGKTKELIKSDVEKYSYPVWSIDGKKIAFQIGEWGQKNISLYYIDISSKKMGKILDATKSNDINIGGWLTEDRIIYAERQYSDDRRKFIGTFLYSIKIDGTDKKLIDQSQNIEILKTFE